MAGHCCVVRLGVASHLDPTSVRSDHPREFVERCSAPKMVDTRVDAKFVVTAAKVLDERLTLR